MYFSGKGVVNVLRGQAFQGYKRGATPNDTSKINGYFPGLSTLKARSPVVEVYNHNFENYIKRIKTAFEKQQLKNMVGFLKFDEMDIRGGYVFAKYLNSVVGGLSDVPLRNFKVLTQKQPQELLEFTATHVFQVVFSALNGSFTVILPFYASYGASGDWVFNIIDQIAKKLNEADIGVCGSCSDGFSGSSTFLQLIRSKRRLWIHFYDYVHIVKKMRCNLQKYEIKDPKNRSFSLRTILNIWGSTQSFYWEINKVKNPSTTFFLL
jgi:hypothetical protein